MKVTSNIAIKWFNEGRTVYLYQHDTLNYLMTLLHKMDGLKLCFIITPKYKSKYVTNGTDTAT